MPDTLDSILAELVKQDGKLIIFCGAGISVNSGLPAAIPLLDEILTRLEIEEEDKLQLISADWKLAMPFEMFFETFLENSDEHQVMQVFAQGLPSTTHHFIVNCRQHNILREVYTTNFDLLIEKAFAAAAADMVVYRTEQSFATIDDDKAACRIIKVHGSIDDMDSIRTTLSTITSRSLTRERERVLDRVFASNDSGLRILVLGYSCSDIFDIVPKIEKIFEPKVSIYLVEHHHSITTRDAVLTEDISLKATDNPFKRYRGKRIKVNTDALIEWLWNITGSSYSPVVNRGDAWKHFVGEWVTGLHSRYLQFTIIGQLFYRISNYDLALKYHGMALLANDSGNKRGEGASYSNIGLVYHDLRMYDKAIENYKKALAVFLDMPDFFYGIAAAYNNLGYSSIYLPDRTGAIKYLKKSLQVSRNNTFRENKRCESDALCNLGLLYEKSADYPNAIYYYTLTLEIDRQGNKSGEAQTLSSLARVHRLTGNLPESVKLFTEAHDIAVKLGMQSQTAYINQQLAELAAMMPDA